MASTTESREQEEIARAFVRARAEASALLRYPGPLPASLEAAYRIQDLAMSFSGGEAAGWKVGRIPAPLSDLHGADRLAGPIFGDAVFRAGETPVSMPVFAGGFAAAEAEFVLRVGAAPDPLKASYTLDEAAALIDAVHVGIEIASSPFPAINDLGPAVTVSDFGNNNGLLIGAAIPDWRGADFAEWPVELLIDGCVVGAGKAAAMPDGPVGAARFLFELLARRGRAVKAGQWISSGAVTGVHPVAIGATVEARFGENHRVSCTIEAARRS